jgi:hypothetical protein
MLRVLRATLRRYFNPLPQVHPGKWYPSVGTQPTERVGCATRGQTNGTTHAPPLVGYLDEDIEADITTCSPNRLVYSLLSEDKLLTDEDRFALSLIDKCAKLAVFYSVDYEEPSANVDIYAVDLKDAGPLRSETAYNIHAVFSKFNDNPSIVFPK